MNPYAEIIGLCEALEDDASDALALHQTQHAFGFYRGQKSTAKSLRRHTADLMATERLRARGTVFVSIERHDLEEIRRSMVLLQMNAEGCALNHYGSDSEEHGLPGWLLDTKGSLENLTQALFPLPALGKENEA